MKTIDGLQKVSYGNTVHIHKNNHVCTNTMDKIRYFQNQEAFYKEYSNSEGRRVNLRPDQKNVSSMMYLVGKYTNPGEVVVEFVAGT